MNRTVLVAASAAVAITAVLASMHPGAAANALAGGAPVAVPAPAVDQPRAAAPSRDTVVVAAGCFWGVQAVFQHVKGVVSATSGYAGGKAKTASYHLVSTGATGHAEAVRVVYDRSQVSLGQILQVFFSVAHDPTELNRQGPDFGPQYRSAIFFAGDEQAKLARAYVEQLDAAKVFRLPIVTEVTKLDGFYPAEDYHQDYLDQHPSDPYILINDLPKIGRLRAQFPALYVEQKAGW
jgi:peptide-methionine (S)-S-oxide reductase